MHINLQTLRHNLVDDPDSKSGKIWRNGRAFYSQGMVTDVHGLGAALAGDTTHYQHVLTWLLMGGQVNPLDKFKISNVIDSHQMLLTWQPVRDGHVHRETTALESTRLALELALKAVLTRCCIQYENRHDLLYLWELLEGRNHSLVHEVREESRSFYHAYTSFVSQLRSLQSELRQVTHPSLTYDFEHMAEIRRISKEIDSLALSSSYSCLPNGAYPGSDQWLDDCLKSFKDWRDRGIRLWTYLRYGDAVEDDMPLPIIGSVHLMARFMYEHLVQIPRQLDVYANSPYRLWPDSVEEFCESRFVENPQ